MASILRHKQTRHGLYCTIEYKLWTYIVTRCEGKNNSGHKYYAGSGIGVCDEWRMSPKSFCEWAIKNGYKKGLEIDRIDNTLGYSPDNCRFVLHKENCASGRRRLFKSNKTGHNGISVSKHGTYEVYITINGKQKYCGVRKTIEDAVALKSTIIGNIHESCNTNTSHP